MDILVPFLYNFALPFLITVYKFVLFPFIVFLCNKFYLTSCQFFFFFFSLSPAKILRFCGWYKLVKITDSLPAARRLCERDPQKDLNFFYTR